MSVQTKIAPEGAKSDTHGEAKTANKKVLAFVEQAKALFKPELVYWCDGSKEEYQAMLKAAGRRRHGAVAEPGETAELDLGALRPQRRRPRRRPDLYLRGEKGRRRPDQQLGRPGRDEEDAAASFMTGRWPGRTMYVIPYSMGPIGSPIANIGVMVTDSAYVVANMHIMTRVGAKVLEGARRQRRLRARHAHGRFSALDAHDRRRAVARATRPNTSATSPRRARSGRTAPATAATRCSARSATRSASRR